MVTNDLNAPTTSPNVGATLVVALSLVALWISLTEWAPTRGAPTKIMGPWMWFRHDDERIRVNIGETIRQFVP